MALRLFFFSCPFLCLSYGAPQIWGIQLRGWGPGARRGKQAACRCAYHLPCALCWCSYSHMQISNHRATQLPVLVFAMPFEFLGWAIFNFFHQTTQRAAGAAAAVLKSYVCSFFYRKLLAWHRLFLPFSLKKKVGESPLPLCTRGTKKG